MQSSHTKIYVTIPGKGNYELSTLIDALSYLRKLSWTCKIWTPSKEFIGKTDNSALQYKGQAFDPWAHDHCEICYETISNREDYSDIDGYETDNGEWVCKNCYLFLYSRMIFKAQ